jgi:exo-1,4-beta-D-glucosaminidase
MRMRRYHLVICLLLGFLFSPWMRCVAASEPGAKLLLREGWSIQSSAQVPEKGEVLSKSGFQPKGWYRASVPSTVLAALVRGNVYADPYFGMNLRSISGTTYPIGDNFSRIQMPPESPFRSSWWYRTEFKIPADYLGKTIWLHFDGINFRANLWLNGRQIATAEKMAGAWRLFEFDVTDLARPGEVNCLAVEVFPPLPNDLAITFVDWNPLPADKDMGLWRDVYLSTSGPVALRFPQVITHLDLPSLEKAHLTVTAELHNATGGAVKGNLVGQIEGLQFSQLVELAANESRVVAFTPDKFPQLNLSSPRLWWPAQLGPQNLYTLDIRFESDGKVSDQQNIRFGIREITSELDAQDHRVFKINGKNILIRGAGWSFDMFLTSSPKKLEAQLKYTKDMNLNTIRLEGKLEEETFFNLCDEYGILVQAGWCCCDHWERWQNWKDEDYVISAESLKDQIRRLRSHPSLFDWLNGSDNPPPSKVEETYIKILKDYNWPNPYQSSATARTTSVTGKTGLKMTGPYEYVSPSYWYLDKTRGGAHGYNTETSPGPAVPPVESLRLMLPEDHLWPINSYWDFHAGGGAFRNLKVFTEALNTRYGTATSLEDYAEKAQVQAYEGHRAMFEAFGRNKYTSTGVIQWMLTNAWPSMIWHLYDYYLRPGGSYFGAKKACEPLHIQYSLDDQSVVVVNSYYQPFKALKATAKVYNLDMTEKFAKDQTLDVPPDSSNRLFVIPELQGLTTTYFLKLALEDSAGKLISSNFYWLSTKPDVSDWDASVWYYTPTKSFSDLTALQSLPKVDLNVASNTERHGADSVTHVIVENPTPHLAFFVHLKVTKGQGGEEVLPVLWQDNYFPLMPGEKREIIATYAAEDLGRAAPVVEVDGWNVSSKSQ